MKISFNKILVTSIIINFILILAAMGEELIPEDISGRVYKKLETFNTTSSNRNVYSKFILVIHADAGYYYSVEVSPTVYATHEEGDAITLTLSKVKYDKYYKPVFNLCMLVILFVILILIGYTKLMWALFNYKD